MDPIRIREYNLPDSDLFSNNVESTFVKVWIPEDSCIVLGRSNNPEESLFIEHIIEDKIPVYKRPSGGETVILTPNTIIISIAIKQSNFKGGKTYFDIINERIRVALQGFGIRDVMLKGISDIALNDIKILGSALYQNKDVVFYHAVLNVAESTHIMDRYLKHPKREPDYRVKRPHSSFVTSLKKEKYKIDPLKLANTLETELKQVRFSTI